MMSTDLTSARRSCAGQARAGEDDRDLLRRSLDAAVVAEHGVRRVVGQGRDQVGAVVGGLGVDELLRLAREPQLLRAVIRSQRTGVTRS